MTNQNLLSKEILGGKMKLVECVPNFSEGRDKSILDQITAVIKNVKGVTLLDVDPGADTNRTVYTMVGSPEVVVEAAFQAIKKASEIIDMSKHHGAHSRMGATDVCPFIPVSDMTMDECVELANKLGKRVGEELDIPVYLYEYAAKSEDRQNLANIRKGEYEALPEKMKDPNFIPDYGRQYFNEKSGATVIGAREFLIAYNINLNTRDKKKAHKIALEIREMGKFKRDSKGKIVKDEKGNKVRIPGIFKNCKAVGWYIDSYNCAQISMNLTNFKITPAHIVLDKVRELASANGIQVTGSELVGLLPKAALIEAGKYYLNKMGESAGLPEEMIIETAVQSMGLNDLYKFENKKKIIEYAIDNPDKLANLSLKEFCDELSTDSPAPGGGSVAALSVAISGALTSMVANLTINKKGYEKFDADAKQLAEQGQKIKEDSLYEIDNDTQAFYEMMDALHLPKKSKEDKEIRNTAVQDATKKAILVPFNTLVIAQKAIYVADKISKIGNKNAISDAGVAAITANAAAKSAFLNIKINMGSIDDTDFKDRMMSDASKILDEINNKAIEVEKFVSDQL